MFLDAGDGNGKGTQVVLLRGFRRGDEIGQGEIRLTRSFFRLLTQELQRDNGFLTILFRQQGHRITAVSVGRPETDNGVGLQPFFGDDPGQHGLSILVKLCCFGTHHCVGQDIGEMPTQFPGDEEGGPINIGTQQRQIHLAEAPCASECGSLGFKIVPVGFETIGDGLSVSDGLFDGLPGLEILSQLCIFAADTVQKYRTMVDVEQISGNRDAP